MKKRKDQRLARYAKYGAENYLQLTAIRLIRHFCEAKDAMCQSLIFSWRRFHLRGPRRYHQMFVSLGYNCELAFRYLRHNGFVDSGLFHWAASPNLEVLIYAIEHLELLYTGVILPPNPQYRLYRCANTNICEHGKAQLFDENGRKVLSAAELDADREELCGRMTYLKKKFVKTLQEGAALVAYKIRTSEYLDPSVEDKLNRLVGALDKLGMRNATFLLVCEEVCRTKQVHLIHPNACIRYVKAFNPDCNVEEEKLGDTIGWQLIFDEFRPLHLKDKTHSYKFEQKKCPRVLIIAHVFYRELWLELRECIKNIGASADLVVTYIDRAAVDQAECDFPNARFVQVENRGFDVWPFLQALQQMDLSRYDVIVKLHTKRDCDIDAAFNGLSLHGSDWRERLLGFCRTPEAWHRTKELLENDDIGMVAGHGVIVSRSTLPRGRLRRSYDRALRQVEEMSGRCAAGGEFVAGTMFAVKPSVFMTLGLERFSARDFPIHQYHNVETFAHRCERMLGLAVRASGLRLVSFDQGDLARIVENRLRIFWKLLRRFFFQRKVTARGFLIVKVCKVTIWRKRAKV